MGTMTPVQVLPDAKDDAAVVPNTRDVLKDLPRQGIDQESSSRSSSSSPVSRDGSVDEAEADFDETANSLALSIEMSSQKINVAPAQEPKDSEIDEVFPGWGQLKTRISSENQGFGSENAEGKNNNQQVVKEFVAEYLTSAKGADLEECVDKKELREMCTVVSRELWSIGSPSAGPLPILLDALVILARSPRCLVDLLQGGCVHAVLVILKGHFVLDDEDTMKAIGFLECITGTSQQGKDTLVKCEGIQNIFLLYAKTSSPSCMSRIYDYLVKLADGCQRFYYDIRFGWIAVHLQGLGPAVIQQAGKAIVTLIAVDALPQVNVVDDIFLLCFMYFDDNSPQIRQDGLRLLYKISKNRNFRKQFVSGIITKCINSNDEERYRRGSRVLRFLLGDAEVATWIFHTYGASFVEKIVEVARRGPQQAQPMSVRKNTATAGLNHGSQTMRERSPRQPIISEAHKSSSLSSGNMMPPGHARQYPAAAGPPTGSSVQPRIKSDANEKAAEVPGVVSTTEGLSTERDQEQLAARAQSTTLSTHQHHLSVSNHKFELNPPPRRPVPATSTVNGAVTVPPQLFHAIQIVQDTIDQVRLPSVRASSGGTRQTTPNDVSYDTLRRRAAMKAQAVPFSKRDVNPKVSLPCIQSSSTGIIKKLAGDYPTAEGDPAQVQPPREVLVVGGVGLTCRFNLHSAPAPCLSGPGEGDDGPPSSGRDGLVRKGSTGLKSHPPAGMPPGVPQAGPHGPRDHGPHGPQAYPHGSAGYKVNSPSSAPRLRKDEASVPPGAMAGPNDRSAKVPLGTSVQPPINVVFQTSRRVDPCGRKLKGASANSLSPQLHNNGWLYTKPNPGVDPNMRRSSLPSKGGAPEEVSDRAGKSTNHTFASFSPSMQKRHCPSGYRREGSSSDDMHVSSNDRVADAGGVTGGAKQTGVTGGAKQTGAHTSNPPSYVIGTGIFGS